MSFRLVTIVCTSLAVLCLIHGSLHATVTFDWATVGDPGNGPDRLYPGHNPDNLQFGAVDYTYRISKHEVTNDQYAEFLNKVAARDPNHLFNAAMDITRSGSDGSFAYAVNTEFGPNPVNFVSFYHAMWFVNWLENGQPSGAQGPTTTDTGVYTIGPLPPETRAPGATFFIPSEDEWYKAAYYDPRLTAAGGPPGDDNYWLYPTQNDADPTAEAPPGGTNSANILRAVGDTTDVGAYPDTTSFYGTFDQGGNVEEWNEGLLIGGFGGLDRGVRGGHWNDIYFNLRASERGFGFPANGSIDIGFRVASIPEPSTLWLVAFGALGLLPRAKNSSQPQVYESDQ